MELELEPEGDLFKKCFQNTQKIDDRRLEGGTVYSLMLRDVAGRALESLWPSYARAAASQ